jgi:hypothetical protein
MVEYECPKCHHSWDFKGKLYQKYFVTCPSCHKSIIPLGVVKNNILNPWAESDWTEFDLKDLKSLSKPGASLKVIAHKLRRDEEDVTNKMIELGMISTPITDPTYYPQPTKEQILIPKTIKHKYDIDKKPPDDIPDLGELLIKIKNDISLLHQDARSIEITISTKMDDLITAVNKNSLLKKEELTIIKEQYAVWKQKHNPAPPNLEKEKETETPLNLSLFGGAPKIH